MVIDVPAGPEVGFRLVMLGGPTTVKLTPLLATPPAVTTTLPVVAFAGTGETMEFALQLVGVAAVPLNVTVPVVPKFVPEMVTEAPTWPEFGLRLLMVGLVEITVKVTPLLATPPAVTTTLPVVAFAGTGVTMDVALQLVGVAAVPLKVTVPVVPKFVPAIVTDAPTNPEFGFRLPIFGVGTTVKLTPLLATPPAVTTMLPVVAFAGTGVTMDVALQLVGVAVVPLNVTVPVLPKFVPVMVTDAPTGPDFGFRLPIFGVGTTVKLTPLLATPPAVATML